MLIAYSSLGTLWNAGRREPCAIPEARSGSIVTPTHARQAAEVAASRSRRARRMRRRGVTALWRTARST